jgi:hypothetical protein
MWTPRGAWPLFVAAALGAVLFVTPAASAKASRPKAPGSLLPANAVKVAQLPVFTWSPVAKADHYEFQVAADKGFNSTVKSTGGVQSTKNTAATIGTALINGTYWWRVRTVTATSATSVWTKGRSFVLGWAPLTNVQGPDDGTSFSTPTVDAASALVLRWAPMPGAAQYAVSIAIDPLLGSLVAGGVQNVDGTNFTLGGTIADGTYYWSVTPLDAEGHKGLPSPVRTFSVKWNAQAGNPVVADLATDYPELMDPLFKWNSVLGASDYELEVSTSQDFATGSRVCCDGRTTATSYSPTTILKNNTYYWRVRPFDPSGNAGIWTVGAPFTQTFDNVPPLVAPAVSGLAMYDSTAFGSSISRSPVVIWNQVMGASAYQINIVPFTAGVCNETNPYALITTPIPAWTPYGQFGSSAPVIGNSGGVTSDGSPLSNGVSYCVEVRAVNTDHNGNAVFGDWTPMHNFTAPAFTYDASDEPVTNAPTAGHYVPAADYVSPVGISSSQTPTMFAWKPITGAQGYYVVVAKDPNFANILDYAFTRRTVYAPRHEYADETTGSQLYWAILPSANPDGSGLLGPAVNIASQANAQTFSKQSVPPTLQPVAVDGSGVAFQWTPVLQASSYTLEVATDPSFSDLIEGPVYTDSASYTAQTSYPAGQTLYYRIQATDYSGNGLAWANGQFSRTLAAPLPAAASGNVNPPALDGIPTWSWAPVPGAVAYDVHVDYPSGSSQDSTGLRASTNSWGKFDGPGVWKWKVRAEFSKGGSGSLPGPWSNTQTFTRTFGEPLGRRVVATKTRLIFAWDAKQGAKTYHMQVASKSDFSSVVDEITVESTSYAPTLTGAGYTDGGLLYWRVAAVDSEGNQGDWTATAKVTLAKALKIATSTTPAKGKTTPVTVTITNAKGAPVAKVSVRVAGAGAIPRAKRTNKKGTVVLNVRPTSVGSLTFRATRSGYQLTTATYQIS